MKKRFVIWAVLAVAVAGGLLAWSMWNKPHTDYAQAEALSNLTSELLVGSFSGGKSEWLNAVVEVRGTVQSVTADGVVLDGGVVCTWSETHAAEGVTTGSPLRIKGRVVGFDDLFGEVRMDACVLQ